MCSTGNAVYAGDVRAWIQTAETQFSTVCFGTSVFEEVWIAPWTKKPRHQINRKVFKIIAWRSSHDWAHCQYTVPIHGFKHQRCPCWRWSFLASIPVGMAILDTGCIQHHSCGSETVRRYVDHIQACGYPVPVPIELPPVELRFQWSLLQQHLVYVGL